ncbi:MAG: hypothetical protein KAG53_08890 [Endozoicomonadaceae bacterium]|nr:hypothetical protein [Endozoicomonadaceae bacterium]
MMKGFTFPTLLSFSVAAAIGGSGYVSSVFARSSPEGHAAAWQCMSTEDNDWHCSPSPGQPYTLTLAEVKELRLESPRSFAKTALKETDVSSSTASLAKDWDLKSESELLALVANDISEDEAKNPELLLQWLERAKKLHSWTEPTTSERVNHLIDTQEQKQAMKHFPADSRLSRLEAQLLSTEINNGDVPKQVLAERDKEVDIFGTPINRQPYIAAQRIMQAQIQAQVQAASFSFVQKQAPAPPAPPPPPPPPPKQSFYQKQTAVANQLLAKQVTGRAQNYVPTPSSMSTPEATSAYAGNQYQSASTPPLSNVARASVELGTRATALRVQSRMQSDMNMPRNRGYSMSNNTLPPEVIQPQGAAPQYHSDPRNPPNPRNVQASRVYEQQQIQLSQFDYKTGEGANLNERPPSAGDYQPAQTARKQSSKLSPYQGQAGWNMAEQSAVSYMPASQQIPVQSPAQEHSSRYRADERMAPSLPKYSAEHARPQTVANNAPQTRFSYKTDRGASLNTSSQSAGNYQKSPMAQPSRYRADERMAPSLPQYSAEPAWSQAAAENTRQSQFGYETSRDASLNTPPQSAGNYQQAQSSRYRADERMASSLPKYNAEPAWSQETAENTRQSQFSYKTGRDANLYTPPQSAGNYQPASMVQPLAQEKPYRYRADERMAPSLPKYNVESVWPKTVAVSIAQQKLNSAYARTSMLNQSPPILSNDRFKHAFDPPAAAPPKSKQVKAVAATMPVNSIERFKLKAAEPDTVKSSYQPRASRPSVASPTTAPTYDRYEQPVDNRYRKVPNAEGKSNHQSADKAYIQPSQYAGGAAQTIKPMGVERFLNAPKSNLTIQWLATTQPAQIMRLQQRFPALRDASVVSFRQQGKIWHVLLSGIYPDKRSANQMLSQKSWKHIVRILNPWARSLGGLHKLDLILPKTTPQSQERYSPAFPQGEYTIQWASARTIEEIREIQASYPQLSGADAIEVSGRNGVSYALVQGRYQNNLTAMDVLRQPRLAKLANDLHSMIRSMASIKNSRLLSQTTFSR